MATDTITGITTATAYSSASAASRTAPDTKPKVSSDYDTFLKMLTAQIRNQDPLNPIQSSDYAVQLATFSGVEQQVRTNDLLTALTERIGGSGLSGIADWVGREARSTGPVSFNGASSVTLSLQPAPRADQAVLVTLDRTGAEVMRQPVPVAGGDFQWTGFASNGRQMPTGSYSFRLESYRGGLQVGDPAVVASYRAVTEVRMGASGAEVVFADGTAVPASDVSGIRSAVRG
jgi:flagellar basal-body rod modification protein FlgD